jgi:hypothetical protein
LKNVKYTAGVHYVAETAGAYWLIDMIAIAQLNENNKDVDPDELLQVWKLTVNPNKTARLTCDDGGKDGNPRRILFTKEIAVTDFPFEEFKLFVQYGMIMLPDEY